MGIMKFISWNVNGFRACLQKGFGDFFTSADADIFCMQETKMQPDQADFSPDGYFKYFHSAIKKGYSGTAVYTKKEPLDIKFGLNGEHTDEGRVITLEFENFKDYRFSNARTTDYDGYDQQIFTGTLDQNGEVTVKDLFTKKSWETFPNKLRARYEIKVFEKITHIFIYTNNLWDRKSVSGSNCFHRCIYKNTIQFICLIQNMGII